MFLEIPLKVFRVKVEGAVAAPHSWGKNRKQSPTAKGHEKASGKN